MKHLIHGLIFLLSAIPAFAQESPSFDNLRHAYVRGETCRLILNAPAADEAVFDVSGLLEQRVPVADGKAVFEFDTTPLRAQDYAVRALLLRGGNATGEASFPLTVAKQHDEERLPVWRWGTGNGDPEWWMARGFTGAFLGAQRAPFQDGSTAASYRFLFDRAAKHDFELGMYYSPLTSEHWKEVEAALVLHPNGNRSEDHPYPLEAQVLAYARDLAETWTAAFADYPALRHVMLQSEYQTPYAINDAALHDAQNAAGLDPRAFFTDTGALINETVQNGVIADNNPRYRFLQWWWQRGHGTAVSNGAMAAAVDQHRPDAITWHDPYRLAPVRKSHAGLDCVATWTYGYPDIKRLCYTTYLQAAARPDKQLVQQDITLFVYGRFAMPLDESTADLSQDFAGGDPYFTAGPDYATEATWIVLSQRPDILCYYSAGRLSPDTEGLDPQYVSPETFLALGNLAETLIRPYGPAILKCERHAPRVALLMSAASTWFSESPRLPGYPNEQTLPYATLLMMNHVPFDVLLDEDVVEGALDRYDVLVMPKADTLLQSMHDRIKAFAEGGGKVIADRSLRAPVPGAIVTDYDFTYQLRIDGPSLANGDAVTATQHREIMEKYAADLTQHLAGAVGPAAADSPRVLTNTLEGGAARYFFYVNDDRTFGPRFGQWKLREELGVPRTALAQAEVLEGAALYDTLLRKLIEYTMEDGRAVFETRLPAAQGKLVAALPEPIGGVTATASAAVAGQPVTLDIAVNGESGAAIAGVIPLRVSVRDPLGRDTEWSRYTATTGGLKSFEFVPAINEPEGDWTVRVTELLSGKMAEATVPVARATE